MQRSRCAREPRRRCLVRCLSDRIRLWVDYLGPGLCALRGPAMATVRL